METIVRRSILEEEGSDYGTDARVRFTMPNGSVIEVCRGGRQDPDDTLTIRAISGETLAVIPRADNTISVMLRR